MMKHEENSYQAAMQQFLARTPKALKPESERYPNRESLYMQHEQQIGNMTIINPFLADIAMLGT